ncbi:MMPL family transporter [Nocardioides jishulii]|uniref:RND transporter n=1 Tax=Nocardioides jishulii TaxID=2575440 RepID=A0A4U2YHK0_9ACTN|nr:MMPL family transporter [Nocardioides jishulii]QCX26690.1 RND transporter [Nocardioides jishulii]TKI60340.1 RND transporter [Nocardioides jishulii]
MAELLYRLGRFSARRAWLVIVAWLLALALAVGAFLTFGGTLTSTVTIPGTPTSEVADTLAEEFPAASGGAAVVAFTTDNDSPLTQAQRQEISDLLERAGEMPGVRETVDPFATEEAVEKGLEELADGRKKLEAGEKELAKGEKELEAGRQRLESGQAQLDGARAALEASGAPAAQLAQLDAQQAQLDAARDELDAGAAKLEKGREELEANRDLIEDSTAVTEMAAEVRQVSEDETTALGTVMFDKPVIEVDVDEKADVAELFTDADIEGVDIELSNDMVQAIPEVFGPGEAVGLAVAALTLFIMLGTFVGAGLPLINALLGVGVGVAGSMALSGTVDMMSVTPVLGLMLGLAVGIDYSLFIINRHKTQMRGGMDLHESIGLANGTSGNAVVFAGATVVTALAALNITGIGFLGLMGTVGAICVVVAVLIAVTMTPALLSLTGHRVLPKRQRGTIVPLSHSTTGTKPMRTSRAVLQSLVGIGVLVVLAIPALDMRLGLPDGSSQPEDSSAYRAHTVTEEKFGAGMNAPLLVVADMRRTLDTDAEGMEAQAEVGTALRELDDVDAVAPIGVSDSRELVAFQVVPSEGPNSVATEQLVHELRGMGWKFGTGIEIGVAGNASGNIDVSEQLSDSLPGYLALVVGLSLVIMVLAFRSILVPLTAALGFVLSLFATFGALTAIFQWGWLADLFGIHAPGPILSFLPVIVIGILFGLAMDYQLFLVSGMREAYVHDAPSRVAVQRGFKAGRVVVTAAAIIMISVFAGFVFSHDAMIRSIGFALAFGVLVDAFVIRMLVIPGVMHLLGDKAWWMPKWLDRIVPNVDVEGAALERNHPGPAMEHEEPAGA